MMKPFAVTVVLAAGIAALVALAGPAMAFSPDQQPQGKVGNRDDQSLDGYRNLDGSPMWAGARLDDARKALGPDAVLQDCRLGSEALPCLMQGMVSPPLKVVNIYYFPNRELRFIVAYVMPYDADTWFSAPADYVGFPETYCDAIASKLIDFITAEAGKWDPGEPPNWREESARFPTSSSTVAAAIKSRGGFQKLTKVAQFTFPKGGHILVERTFNTDDQECRARAIYYLADSNAESDAGDCGRLTADDIGAFGAPKPKPGC